MKRPKSDSTGSPLRLASVSLFLSLSLSLMKSSSDRSPAKAASFGGSFCRSDRAGIVTRVIVGRNDRQALAAVERGITTAVQYPHPVGVWPHDVLVITCTRSYVSDTYIRLSVDLRTARLTMSELSRYYLGGSGRCFSIPSFHLHSPFTPLALAFHLCYPAASSVYRTKKARARGRERERERGGSSSISRHVLLNIIERVKMA